MFNEFHFRLLFMLRHRFATFLLIFFLVSQGTILLHITLLSVHKKETQNKLNKLSSFQVLEFSTEEWNTLIVKNGKEIEFNRKMFDIHHITYSRNMVQVHGHFDEKEDFMLKDIKGHQKKQAQKGSSFAFAFLYFEDIEQISFFNAINYTNYSMSLTEIQSQLFQKNTSPPPKIS